MIVNFLKDLQGNERSEASVSSVGNSGIGLPIFHGMGLSSGGKLSYPHGRHLQVLRLHCFVRVTIGKASAGGG